MHKWSLWSTLGFGLALIGLLFLPIDYRGGSDQPHAHSLLQLLIDGGDGHLQHAHATAFAPEAGAGEASWFDPIAGSFTAGTHAPVDDTEIDAGQQHGSAATYSSIPMVLAAMIAVPAPIGILRPVITGAGRMTGRLPRVLVPPPRLMTASN